MHLEFQTQEGIKMSFGSDPNGGFNEASIAYKDSPTIENYLRLRRSNPDDEIEVSVLGGIDALFAMQDELKQFGFDPDEIPAVLDADPEAISALSLKLLESIVEGKQLEERGETQTVRRGLVVPNKLIDWLICIMLEATSWNDREDIHRDLIVLIKERLLGGAYSHYVQTVQSHELKQRALWLGAQLKAQGHDVSIRKIASALSIAPSTVSRWFPEQSFQDEVKKLSCLFDENGKLRPLSELRTSP